VKWGTGPPAATSPAPVIVLAGHNGLLSVPPGKATAVSRVVEQGDIFFFYRPRVGVERVRSLDDVQRFFFVLRPQRSRRYRRIIVGRKRLPEAREHERAWAFVADVTDDPADLHDELAAFTYETRTRGVRAQPAARPVGEGRYAIVDHDGHTHLAYVLELPPRPGPAQDLFRVRPEGSFVIAVRNPCAETPPGTGLPPHERPELPTELLERFGSRRFIAVDDPRLLDFDGAELVLIGASEDVESELGIALHGEHERLENADIFRRLRLHPGQLPVEPLARGESR
jgi:hypothetical protein